MTLANNDSASIFIGAPLERSRTAFDRPGNRLGRYDANDPGRVL